MDGKSILHLHLISGEDYMGVVIDVEDYYEIFDPLIFDTIRDPMNNVLGYSFSGVKPLFIDGSIKINKDKVIFITEVDPIIEDKYLERLSYLIENNLLYIQETEMLLKIQTKKNKKLLN